MRKHHPNNERVKRDYLTFLERARRMSPSSVDQVAAAIHLFEEGTNFKDFRKFHRNQAIAFHERLGTAINEKTGKPLAKATIHSRLMALKAFIQWLQGQPGFRSKITYDDAEYFNPSANDERIAKAVRERPIATLEQLRQAFDGMPAGSIVERRDRALFSTAVLTGARDGALASFAIKHVDIGNQLIFQDARTVRTKNAKTFISDFLPVDLVYGQTLAEWLKELGGLGFGPEDPLFPATSVDVGPDRQFVVTGLTREFWKSASPVRRIFREAFDRAGLPSFNPHSFRNTVAIHGEKSCQSPEEWKAFSQSLGHSSPMTTFMSYGEVPRYRQAEIMADLRRRFTNKPNRPEQALDEDTVRRVLAAANAVGRPREPV